MKITMTFEFDDAGRTLVAAERDILDLKSGSEYQPRLATRQECIWFLNMALGEGIALTEAECQRIDLPGELRLKIKRIWTQDGQRWTTVK